MADNEDNRMAVRGGKALLTAIRTMEKILVELDSVCRSLRYLRSDVKDFQTKCNGFKTAGTSANVVGAGAAIGKTKAVKTNMYLFN